MHAYFNKSHAVLKIDQFSFCVLNFCYRCTLNYIYILQLNFLLPNAKKAWIMHLFYDRWLVFISDFCTELQHCFAMCWCRFNIVHAHKNCERPIGNIWPKLGVNIQPSPWPLNDRIILRKHAICVQFMSTWLTTAS